MFVQIVIVASSSYLMLRRLCPLYGNSRRIIITLNVAFFSTYITVIIMSVVAAYKLARKYFRVDWTHRGSCI